MLRPSLLLFSSFFLSQCVSNRSVQKASTKTSKIIEFSADGTPLGELASRTPKDSAPDNAGSCVVWSTRFIYSMYAEPRLVTGDIAKQSNLFDRSIIFPDTIELVTKLLSPEKDKPDQFTEARGALMPMIEHLIEGHVLPAKMGIPPPDLIHQLLPMHLSSLTLHLELKGEASKEDLLYYLVEALSNHPIMTVLREGKAEELPHGMSAGIFDDRPMGKLPITHWYVLTGIKEISAESYSITYFESNERKELEMPFDVFYEQSNIFQPDENSTLRAIFNRQGLDNRMFLVPDRPLISAEAASK